MATIYVHIKDIKGGATNLTYKDQIHCVAMRHVFILPLEATKFRTLGPSKHGAIALTHAVDKASPLLKKHAMTNPNNLGTVKITRVRAGATSADEIIQMTNVQIVRVDLETPLSPSTLQPGDDLMETFYLDYSGGAIRWSQAQPGQTGMIEATWDVANQTKQVSDVFNT